MTAVAPPIAAPPLEATGRRRRRRRTAAEWTRIGVLTTAFAAIVIAFLSPLAYSALTSIKTPQQISAHDAPLLPSDPATFDYQGKTYPVYVVPMPDGTTR